MLSTQQQTMQDVLLLLLLLLASKLLMWQAQLEPPAARLLMQFAMQHAMQCAQCQELQSRQWSWGQARWPILQDSSQRLQRMQP
jgi:hypothetical protein